MFARSLKSIFFLIFFLNQCNETMNIVIPSSTSSLNKTHDYINKLSSGFFKLQKLQLEPSKIENTNTVI